MAGDRAITLAAIVGAHGVNGEVRLKLFGEGVESLKRFRAFNDSALVPEKLRDDGKGGAIARFAGVSDRNAAEALRGTPLTVPRSDLPPLDEGEYYHADLIGLAALTTTGEVLGTVIGVDNFGAGDVIEIERPAVDGKPGKRFMVPMRPQAVPEWNGERLLVDPAWVEP